MSLKFESRTLPFGWVNVYLHRRIEGKFWNYKIITGFATYFDAIRKRRGSAWIGQTASRVSYLTFLKNWLNCKDREMVLCNIFRDGHEVAFVYYRCGYSPEQYSSSDGCEWDARLNIERSRAIKCPSINYHLAGTKKVQQLLSQPGVLEELFDDVDKVKQLKACFTGLYSLDLVIMRKHSWRIICGNGSPCVM